MSDDARADLQRLLHGFQVSQAIHVAVALGLADKMENGPADAAALSRMTGAHPDALHRLLRVLAAVGVLTVTSDGAFALTAMGAYLRRDAIGSCAPMAELFGRPNVWHAWGELSHAIRTGTTAFDHVHGCNVWDYRKRRPEEADVFDKAMASGTARFAKAVLDACDFNRFSHVVDIGGGDGTFLTSLLERHPRMNCTLFDQPDVIARTAGAHISETSRSRLRAVGGNFFECVPEGGDAYLLKWILHDWSDTAAVDILASCRRAMTPSGRLLVAEYIVGPGYASPAGELMDLTMMVMNGGRERTHDEFSSLLASAGFRMISITRTATPLCVIEGAITDGL